MKAYFTLILICLPVLLWSQKNQEFNLDETFTLKSNGTLHMNTDDADIKITGSNRSDVRVVIFRKMKSGGIRWGGDEKDINVDVYSRDGDLYINDRPSNGVSWAIMGYSYEEYRINIEAPLATHLDIEGDDDDYRVRNIHGSIDMRVDDGDIELLDCRGSEFEFRVDDGDLVMDGGKGKLYADIEDGDLEITNGSFREVVAKADDGNISIETTLNNLGNYRMSSDDGSVEIYVTRGGGSFEVSHDDSRISVGPDFNVIEKSDHHSTYKLAGGNASVDIRADDGSVRLRSQVNSN